VAVSHDVEARAAGSVVEHFGGWVGAGWVARAGGQDSGVAAEPCVSTAGTRRLLPDGTTSTGQDAWVVVMNPFASEAVVGLTLVTESRTVRKADTTLGPRRVTAFHLNDLAEGERTVATVVEASLGRVAAASLGFAEDGGVRAAVGMPGDQVTSVLPGALDAGGSLVPMLNPADRGTGYGVTAMTRRGTIPSEDVTGEPLGPLSIRTEELTLPVPSSVVVRAGSDVALAVARRTLGLRGDNGSTAGVAPEEAWVVATAMGERDDTSRVVLANPGPRSVTVRLVALGPEGRVGAPLEVLVPRGAAVEAPARLTEDTPFTSVVAVADGGTFVAASASYSPSATGYAVSLGVPIPPRWMP
jgi:hypothetical protein